MIIINIVLFFIAVILLVVNGTNIYKKHQYNIDIDKKNKKLLEEKIQLNFQIEQLENKKQSLEEIVNNKNDEIVDLTSRLNTMEETIESAFEKYCDNLENSYVLKKQEYTSYEDILKRNYTNLQNNILQDIQKIKQELEKIKATKAAAIQAQLKEQEIKDNKSIYSISLTENELDDVKALEKIKKQLWQPRILSMLIWQTYYQKSMKLLCAKVLKQDEITGIYKITNQLNDMCYIGQSVNVRRSLETAC